MLYNFNPPFNGDKYVVDEFKKLVKEFNIKTIIETGTYKADTTNFLAGIVDTVHTIEVNSVYFDASHKRIAEIRKKNKNVFNWFGSSPVVLRNLLNPNKNFVKNDVMFFLDAHWYKYNPLLDELKTIAERKIKKCVIAIHDFKVPDKDFGYDSYNGHDYDYDYIKSDVEKIYGSGNFKYYYNDEATGSRRGIIYIIPNWNLL